MSRFTFGGGIADYTMMLGADVTIGPLTGQAVVVVGGQSITFWSDEQANLQYDDLLDIDGQPISVVTSEDGSGFRSMGQIPPFQGPDGVAEMWAQAGDGPRSRMVAIGVSGIDETLAGSLSIDGTLTVAGGFSASGQASVDGDLTVTGSLVVDGTLTLNDPQQTAFSKTLLVSPSAVGTWPVWRAPKACRVTAVQAQRVGGTGAAVNVLVNGVKVLSVDLALAVADSWTTGAPAAPVAVAAGDSLSMSVVSHAGAPSVIAVQADLVVV